MSTLVVPGGMCAVHYKWPPPPDGKQSGHDNLDVYLTIQEAPEDSQYYWGHQFWFIEGNGGYFGLQTGGAIGDQPAGKIAIFSIWDAKTAQPAPNGVAECFAREGEGWSCRLAYNWHTGREYRLRLSEVSDAQRPTEQRWWGAWIMETETRKESFLGQILVPESWQRIKNQTNWFVEYFGQTYGCEAIPYASATFGRPSMDNATAMPESLRLEAYGPCACYARVGCAGDDSMVSWAQTGVRSKPG